MPEQVIDLLCYVVAFVVGAWVHYRGRSGQSPLPTWPKKAEADEAETPITYRKVKP